MVEKERKLLEKAYDLLAKMIRDEPVDVEEAEDLAMEIIEHLAGHDPENN